MGEIERLHSSGMRPVGEIERLHTSSDDRTAKIWCSTTGECLLTLADDCGWGAWWTGTSWSGILMKIPLPSRRGDLVGSRVGRATEWCGGCGYVLW